jgi:hypothetical protein
MPMHFSNGEFSSSQLIQIKNSLIDECKKINLSQELVKDKLELINNDIEQEKFKEIIDEIKTKNGIVGKKKVKKEYSMLSFEDELVIFKQFREEIKKYPFISDKAINKYIERYEDRILDDLQEDLEDKLREEYDKKSKEENDVKKTLADKLIAKFSDIDIPTMTVTTEKNKCQYVLTRGKNKGNVCNKIDCKRHKE